MVNTKVHCHYDKLVDPKTLRPHPANPARHPEGQVKLLAKIMGEHGIRHPIIVSKKSKFIVSGHCRREAAIELGVTAYPVEYHDYKSQSEELAVLVADNHIQELAETDGALMGELLVNLDQHNYPMELTALSDVQVRRFVEGPPLPPDSPIPDAKFGVILECDSEQQQKELFEEFTERGLTCKLLTL